MSDEHLLIRQPGTNAFDSERMRGIMRDMLRNELDRWAQCAAERRARDLVDGNGKPLRQIGSAGQTIKVRLPQRFTVQPEPQEGGAQ